MEAEMYVILRKSPDDSHIAAVSAQADISRAEQVLRNIIGGFGEECATEWNGSHRCVVEYHGIKFEYWIVKAIELQQ